MREVFWIVVVVSRGRGDCGFGGLTDFGSEPSLKLRGSIGLCGAARFDLAAVSRKGLPSAEWSPLMPSAGMEHPIVSSLDVSDPTQAR